MQLLELGNRHRTTRSTDYNMTSSRSHAILQLTFEIERTDSGQTVISHSKLSLVDLAGSEKMLTSTTADTGKHVCHNLSMYLLHTPSTYLVNPCSQCTLSTHPLNTPTQHILSTQQIRELTSINSSLHCLGNVIAALSSTTRSHVPYRDSKLTRLLQDSLGGNTRTIVVACVAPTALHAAETVSTLQFADRAKSVMLRVNTSNQVTL